MKDRVPVYPGRVKLVPVSGQENVYDMTRADQPTQQGDPLNKATLLKDATAALYGLGADAVPDDVLSKIKSLIEGVKNELRVRKNIILGSYTGTGESGPEHFNSLSFEEAPTVVAIYGYHRTDTSNPYYKSLPGGKTSVWIMDVTSWPVDAPNQYVGFGNGNSYGQKSSDGKTIRWATYSGDAEAQFNEAGNTYHYFAII